MEQNGWKNKTWKIRDKSHHAKTDLNKKSGAMHQALISLQYWCPRVQKNKKWKSFDTGNRSYQLTSAVPADLPMVVFLNPWESILKGLVHCTRLFIQFRFGMVWSMMFQKVREQSLRMRKWWLNRFFNLIKVIPAQELIFHFLLTFESKQEKETR